MIWEIWYGDQFICNAHSQQEADSWQEAGYSVVIVLGDFE